MEPIISLDNATYWSLDPNEKNLIFTSPYDAIDDYIDNLQVQLADLPPNITVYGFKKKELEHASISQQDLKELLDFLMTDFDDSHLYVKCDGKLTIDLMQWIMKYRPDKLLEQC